MKKFRYVSSFIGLMALCAIVGMAFFIYCDSGDEDGKEGDRSRITVNITVDQETERISLEIDYPDNRVSDPEVIEAKYNEKIEWKCSDERVLDLVLFFGGNSPLGDVEEEMAPGEEWGIYSAVRSVDVEGKMRGPKKQVYHNPKMAGGRHAKYYIVVYWLTDPNDPTSGKILIRDPDIIIPPRGGRR